MRAVSSPSLCENPLDIVKCPQKKARRDETVQTHPPQSSNSTTTTSVLQKFRKTFSNLKGKSSSSSISSNNGPVALAPTNGVVGGGNSNHVSSNNSSVASINSGSIHPMVNTTSFDNADIIKYRFGPLIWRTSKERRKTKHHRRDKCNSGDSGIQVELENDENVISNDVIDGLNASPSFNVRVRRANSAKVASNSMASTAKARVLKRNEGSDKLYLTPIRSLSQPYGLNQIAPCKCIYHLSLPFLLLSFGSLSFEYFWHAPLPIKTFTHFLSPSPPLSRCVCAQNEIFSHAHVVHQACLIVAKKEKKKQVQRYFRFKFIRFYLLKPLMHCMCAK